MLKVNLFYLLNINNFSSALLVQDYLSLHNPLSISLDLYIQYQSNQLMCCSLSIILYNWIMESYPFTKHFYIDFLLFITLLHNISRNCFFCLILKMQINLSMLLNLLCHKLLLHLSLLRLLFLLIIILPICYSSVDI